MLGLEFCLLFFGLGLLMIPAMQLLRITEGAAAPHSVIKAAPP